MNRNDLEVALMFLEPSDVPETVVLQCYRAKDIPFVKRLLRHTLGDPSMMLEGHSWRYGKKTFIIKPYTSDLHGFRGKVFYISYEDEHDWEQVVKTINEGYDNGAR